MYDVFKERILIVLMKRSISSSIVVIVYRQLEAIVFSFGSSGNLVLVLLETLLDRHRLDASHLDGMIVVIFSGV